MYPLRRPTRIRHMLARTPRRYDPDGCGIRWQANLDAEPASGAESGRLGVKVALLAEVGRTFGRGDKGGVPSGTPATTRLLRELQCPARRVAGSCVGGPVRSVLHRF